MFALRVLSALVSACFVFSASAKVLRGRTPTHHSDSVSVATTTGTTPSNNLIDEFVSISCSGSSQYVAALGDNLYVSSDYGQSYTTASINPLNSYTFNEVAVAKEGPIMVAVGDGVVEVSRDYGQTWTQPTSTAFQGTNWVAVALNQTGQAMYIASESGAGIYASFDAGASFAVLPNSNFSVVDLACTYGGSTIFALASNALHISTNHGQSWTTQTASFIGGWLEITFSANGMNAVAVGDYGVIYSKDGGNTWDP